jgi:hypothetical protein
MIVGTITREQFTHELWLQVVQTHPLWEATRQWAPLLYQARRAKAPCADTRQDVGERSCGKTGLLWLISLTKQWQRFWPGVTTLLSKTITIAHWKIYSGWIKKCWILYFFIHIFLFSQAAWCSRKFKTSRYSRRISYECQLDYWLSWLRFVMGFLSLLCWMLRQYLETGQGSLLQNHYPFTTTDHIYHFILYYQIIWIHLILIYFPLV